MTAIKHQLESLVEALVNHADINMARVDEDGKTAEDYALSSRNETIYHTFENRKWNISNY